MIGGALAWASVRTAGMRPYVLMRPELRSETTAVLGGSTPVTFTFIRIMDLRVIEAQHQLHHQCHQCLRGQEGQGVHAMTDTPARNQEVT